MREFPLLDISCVKLYSLNLCAKNETFLNGRRDNVNWFEFVQGFGFVLILLYLLCGVDDTIWFILAIIAGIFRKKKEKEDEVLDFRVLRNTPPKMLAVSIAAWHEANVIGDVITNFINTTDYPRSMYHLFVHGLSLLLLCCSHIGTWHDGLVYGHVNRMPGYVPCL